MSDSLNDSRTLEDIWSDDKAMTDDAIKNAKKYVFGNSHKKAQAFIGDCLNKTLKRCGLTISPHMKPKMAERLMKTHGVEIESRTKFRDEKDAWKNGIYVFRHGELVAFISQMFVFRPNRFKIDRNPYIAVITNAKV